MSEETPSVEEIKDRLKVEIPVEEEVTKAEAQDVDVVEELKGLGRQMAETLQSAWNSEERQKFESEVREGMKSFAGEVDKMLREVKESDVAGKVKEEAAEVKTRVETAELGQKTRGTFVQGLQWLSEELGKLAESFNPPEKSPEAAEDVAAAEESAE